MFIEKMNNHVIPLFFIITTPLLVQYLANIGQDKEFNIHNLWKYIIGNNLSWSLLFISIIWAVIWMKLSSQKLYGPVTYYNEKPEFPGNAFLYYLASVLLYLICQWIWPQLSSSIFWNMPYIIGTLNITSFIFCVYLCAKGLISPDRPTDIKGRSVLNLFYSGIELHPQIFGIYIKQITICRLGVLYWQIIILAHFITALQRYGFNSGLFVNFILQTLYLAKCNYWEEAYFWSLDMMYDAAGYYLCWGVMVLVPALYAYSTYYLVLHPPIISDQLSIALFAIGLFSILLNTRVDYEKLEFKKNVFNDNFKLWGKKVEFIPATYKDHNGKVHRSRLLVSGCWGTARHLNYLCELTCGLAWSLPGLGLGVHTFLYLISTLVLIVHRCFRDEKRCYEKYGDGYKKYCEIVPYRILPFVF